MNEEYDAIVLGTGLKECILAGLLAKLQGKKILQIDRNSYYGAESASLNLTNLYKMFRGDKKAPDHYGENRDWNVDLIPKFVMSDGDLIKLLLKTGCDNYLQWLPIDFTYVYQWDKGGIFSKAKGVIHKVPSNDREAVSSDLMGLFEKNRCRKFFQWVQDYDVRDSKTHKDIKPTQPFKDAIKKFGLEPNTTDFIGHAVALNTNDLFLDQPTSDTLDKIKLYMNSAGKYGETGSPFLYPEYGLSGLAEGFSRICALYGGTYMLNRDCDEILFDENGKFKGIKSQGETAYSKLLITDPSYVKSINKVKSIGKVIRCICIMNHPIPKVQTKKDQEPSCQIILPQKQIGRKNDIFIASLNETHKVSKKGYYIAIISTVVETNNPQEELKPAFQLLGDVLDTYITVSDEYVPVNEKFEDNVYVTKSFDAKSHFVEDIKDVLALYEKMVGSPLDLKEEKKN